jgi:hypothetical protein
MKNKIVSFVFTLALLAGLVQTARATVNFTITPSAVSNTYSGTITLQVTGLTNTETVVIQKFLDANTNGVIDAGDLLWQQFKLTDGTNFVIGGVTNVNVPGDTDGTANGTIVSKLYLQPDFAQTVAGNYLIKLSSPGGHFSPITNSFTVTNLPYAQKFTGTVASNGVAVPNAVVILFDGSNQNLNTVGAAVANNAGLYSIPAPVGTYLLAAFKTNFLADTTAAAGLVLNASANFHTNLNLIVATNSISGKVVDTNNSSLGLPGLLLPVQNRAGLLGICFTDTNGNFTARVTADQWQVQSISGGIALHGYLELQNEPVEDASTGSVAGVSIALPKATALFYGTVKDNFGNPLPGTVAVEATDNNGNYIADGFTDTNGYYVTGALGGLGSGDPWQVQVDNSSSYPNYIFSQPDFDQNGNGTNLTVGKAVLANITAILATNNISGNVQANGTNIVGVGVYAYATIGGVQYNAYADTDDNGNYSFNVANGRWNVGVNQQGGDDSLDGILGDGNYQPPNEQNVSISNSDGTADFNIQLCDGVQILTSSPLPGAQVGSYYDIQLEAAACNNNFTWSVNDPADFPYGLGMDFNSDGEIFGTPTGSGTYHFSVHVDDNNGHTADSNMTLVVTGSSAPLQITTTSLSAGMVSNSYSQQLNASGGQPAYSWSLSPGSLALPSGLNLGSGGIISGTPNAPGIGTNYFSVRVTDGAASTVDQPLNIIVYQMLLITNTTLPTGTVSVAYSAQLGKSGGAAGNGYGWAVNSGSFPPGLNLLLDGSISGTPTMSGTFLFSVGFIDNSGFSTSANLSIIVQPASLQITTASLSNAIIGLAYTNQLAGSGGTTPYTWTIANGSQPLPAVLTLSTNGIISGVPAAGGTNSFIVRLTDATALTTTKSLTLVVIPKPVLNLSAWLTNQSQLRLTGVAGQNYTLQMSTNLNSPNWVTLFSTNNTTTNSYFLTDPNATNKQRFYRVLIGP